LQNAILALRVLGIFVLGGIAMAAFTFGVSLLISVDTLHLYVAMFVSVLGFSVIGLFYSAIFFVRISRRSRTLFKEARPKDRKGDDTRLHF
jgi:hypothetical protein